MDVGERAQWPDAPRGARLRSPAFVTTIYGFPINAKTLEFCPTKS
jgi:hypothetical protein